MSKAKIAIAAAVAVLVIAAAGLVYFFSGDAADAPTVDNAKSSKATEEAKQQTDVDTNGTWTLNSDSIAQYRVKELLSGAEVTATGTTSEVTGSLTLDDTTISEASFEVGMGKFESDKSQRDDAFRGRIMEASTYPTSTFTLTKPIELDAVPAEGAEIKVTATGDLTLKDVTKSIGLELTARREGAIITVAGAYVVVFADWNIDNPSFGFVETEDQGSLEVSLVFAKG